MRAQVFIFTVIFLLFTVIPASYAHHLEGEANSPRRLIDHALKYHAQEASLKDVLLKHLRPGMLGTPYVGHTLLLVMGK